MDKEKGKEMKKYILNGIYIVITFFIVVAGMQESMQERWSLAILLVLFLILIQLDQIHDTLKARGEK